jgi:hypothetical protein
LLQRLLEAVGVELTRGEREGIAGGSRLEEAIAEDLA